MNKSCTSKNVGYGALGGLVGGIVFGIMMAKMGVLIKIGSMIGMPNPVAGFAVHLIISMAMGVIFALIFYKAACKRLSGSICGIIYGIIWWFLGPITLMPIMMGEQLGSMWNASVMQTAFPSLFGHIVFGLLLGFTYGWMRSRKKTR